MCNDELTAELAGGKRLATALVEHLIRMGAAAGTVPVWVEDQRYEVEVRIVPVKKEQ